MAERIKLGDKIYDLGKLSPKGRKTFEQLVYTTQRLEECQQKEQALARAKNAYITDLREEIVAAQSGINLSELLGD